ncbi:MAG: 2-C-methyl-D-erythritol 2,4-cyclodiphosphate synthase [Bacteroidales bacterium]|nr:2-C-methyl-D-erythritol 2,4-cyclodiphosphate synthase [Bacteroidales bacterium]
MDIRVGYGYDVHQLREGLEMWIGGVKVEHTKGWVAHSDGDVLIHAICDALLGAAGMRDIGYHFPDTSDDFKGIDSKILLKRTVDLIATKGYRVGNIDSTIALQRPKIKPLIENMQQTLADVIGVDVDRISVKATTTEKLGFEGEEQGASAYAVALICK